jgi:hypothetical protein
MAPRVSCLKQKEPGPFGSHRALSIAEVKVEVSMMLWFYLIAKSKFSLI